MDGLDQRRRGTISCSEGVDERNLRMLNRALPLLEEGCTFIAVGALHLPGEKGLLALIEAAGFDVRPLASPFVIMHEAANSAIGSVIRAQRVAHELRQQISGQCRAKHRATPQGFDPDHGHGQHKQAKPRHWSAADAVIQAVLASRRLMSRWSRLSLPPP